MESGEEPDVSLKAESPSVTQPVTCKQTSQCALQVGPTAGGGWGPLLVGATAGGGWGPLAGGGPSGTSQQSKHRALHCMHRCSMSIMPEHHNRSTSRDDADKGVRVRSFEGEVGPATPLEKPHRAIVMNI